MFRKIIFWTHLCLGLVAAIGVIAMSVTGVLLAYEHQFEHWADERTYAGRIEVSEEPLSVDELLLAAQASVDWSPLSLTLYSKPESAALLGGNPREGLQAYFDPYTGANLGPGNTGVQTFFGETTRWHRWFDVDGDMRAVAGAVIDISNVIFLVLIITGIYLWLPPLMRWGLIKARLWFTPVRNSKARDFNWHHVFSVWALIPLFVIVFSGARISYQWPDDLVRAVFSTEAPAVEQIAEPVVIGEGPQQAQLSLDDLVDDAAARYSNWKSIELGMPREGNTQLQVVVAMGEGRQPQKEVTLIYDREQRSLSEVATFGDRSAADRVLGLMLPLHTGEALGLFGQTLALLASVASLILVYTGAALSYRRLIQPLLAKRA